MNRFSKQEIIKRYKNLAFPKERITKEALEFKEFLFENDQNKQFIDESMIFGNPNLDNKKNLSESFYDPNDTMFGGENNFNPNKNYKGKNTNWRKNISKNESKDTKDFYSNRNNNNYEADSNRLAANAKNNFYTNNNNYKGNKARYENNQVGRNADFDISSSSFSLVYEARANKKNEKKENEEIKDYDPNDSENDKIIENRKQQNKNSNKPKKAFSQEPIEESSEDDKNAINERKPQQQMNKNNKKPNNSNNRNLIFDEKLKHEISQAGILVEKEEEGENQLAENNQKQLLNVEANEIENVNLGTFSKSNFCGEILEIKNKSSHLSNNSNNNLAFTGALNFKKIYEINKTLKYPENKPLWYLNHPEANSSFGPLSTKQLEVMYSKKEINEATKIRFIDLIKFKNKANFEFVAIKELESPEILMEIEMNGLYKSLSAELASIKVIEVKSLLKSNAALNNVTNNPVNFNSSNSKINILNKNNKNDFDDKNINAITEQAVEANAIPVSNLKQPYGKKVIVNVKKENKKPAKKIKEAAEPLDLPTYDKSLFEVKQNPNSNNNNNQNLGKKLIINDNNNLREEEDYMEENATNDNIKEIHNLINQQLKKVFEDEEDNHHFINMENKKDAEMNIKKNLNKDIQNFGKEERGNIANKNNLESEITGNNQAAFGMVKKTNKKKGKAQRVNIDVKTGFYTLSEQEKVYDPIFIVGEHE